MRDQQLLDLRAERDQQIADLRAEIARREAMEQTEALELRRESARAAYYHELYLQAVPEGERAPSYSQRAGVSDVAFDMRAMPPPPPRAPHEGGSES